MESSFHLAVHHCCSLLIGLHFSVSCSGSEDWYSPLEVLSSLHTVDDGYNVEDFFVGGRPVGVASNVETP